MPFELFLSPQGHLHVHETAESPGAGLDSTIGKRIAAAFERGTARGLLHRGPPDLQATLPPPFSFARAFARLSLPRLCQSTTGAAGGAIPPIPVPASSDLAFQALQAPPI